METAITTGEAPGNLEEYFFYKDTTRQNDFLVCIPEELHPRNHYNMGGVLFLLDGAKAYFDSPGSHFEYALAEAGSADIGLRYEKAAERKIAEFVRRANLVFPEKYNVWLRVFKSNVDASGVRTYGTHENYLILRNDDTNLLELCWTLGPLLAARNAFLGAGLVCADIKSGRMSYKISQRTSFIKGVVGGNTTDSRALINDRDEAHAPSIYRRLHLICGDGLMLESAIRLRLGMMDVVFDMIEEGGAGILPFGSGYDAGDILRALLIFDEDTTLRKKAQINGIPYSAVDILQIYYSASYAFCERAGHLTEDRKKTFALWKRFLDAAREPDPQEALAPLADWALKKTFIEWEMARRKYSWRTPINTILTIPKKDEKGVLHEKGEKVWAHTKAMDLDFSELSPKGHANFLVRKGIAEQILSEEEIESIMYRPVPGDTRADPRSLWLRWARENASPPKNYFSITGDWTYLRINSEGTTRVFFHGLDPFNVCPLQKISKK